MPIDSNKWIIFGGRVGTQQTINYLMQPQNYMLLSTQFFNFNLYSDS